MNYIFKSLFLCKEALSPIIVTLNYTSLNVCKILSTDWKKELLLNRTFWMKILKILFKITARLKTFLILFFCQFTWCFKNRCSIKLFLISDLRLIHQKIPVRIKNARKTNRNYKSRAHGHIHFFYWYKLSYPETIVMWFNSPVQCGYWNFW